jgi:hypothetical protein
MFISLECAECTLFNGADNSKLEIGDKFCILTAYYTYV